MHCYKRSREKKKTWYDAIYRSLAQREELNGTHLRGRARSEERRDQETSRLENDRCQEGAPEPR